MSDSNGNLRSRNKTVESAADDHFDDEEGGIVMLETTSNDGDDNKMTKMPVSTTKEIQEGSRSGTRKYIVGFVLLVSVSVAFLFGSASLKIQQQQQQQPETNANYYDPANDSNNIDINNNNDMEPAPAPTADNTTNNMNDTATTPAPVASTNPPVAPVAPTNPPVAPVAPTNPPVAPVAPTKPPVAPVAPTNPPVAPTEKPTEAATTPAPSPKPTVAAATPQPTEKPIEAAATPNPTEKPTDPPVAPPEPAQAPKEPEPAPKEPEPAPATDAAPAAAPEKEEVIDRNHKDATPKYSYWTGENNPEENIWQQQMHAYAYCYQHDLHYAGVCKGSDRRNQDRLYLIEQMGWQDIFAIDDGDCLQDRHKNRHTLNSKVYLGHHELVDNDGFLAALRSRAVPGIDIKAMKNTVVVFVDRADTIHPCHAEGKARYLSNQFFIQRIQQYAPKDAKVVIYTMGNDETSFESLKAFEALGYEVQREAKLATVWKSLATAQVAILSRSPIGTLSAMMNSGTVVYTPFEGDHAVLSSWTVVSDDLLQLSDQENQRLAELGCKDGKVISFPVQDDAAQP